MTDDNIKEVINRTSIVEIINSTVPLKKKGSNYFGLSPFKKEKTPSFSVNEEKKIFYWSMLCSYIERVYLMTLDDRRGFEDVVLIQLMDGCTSDWVTYILLHPSINSPSHFLLQYRDVQTDMVIESFIKTLLLVMSSQTDLRVG